MITTAPVLFVLGVLSARGSGLVAGVLFGFSSFIMRALARLPAAQGVRAMQSINVTVTKSLFVLLSVGTAIGAVLVPILVAALGPVPGARYLVAGSILYFSGTFMVTVVYHVPRNNARAVVQPAGTEAIAAWPRYVSGWTDWNHVRTAAALAACVSLALAVATA